MNIIDVSETFYERLFIAGFSHLITQHACIVTVDDETYTVEAMSLSYDSRHSIIEFLELERHRELLTVFDKKNESSGSTDILHNLEYVKLLTQIYEETKNEHNQSISLE